MATFAFKAFDLAGVPTRGEMDGDDKQAVRRSLRRKGLIVVDIEELKPASASDIFAPLQAGQGGRARRSPRASSRRWSRRA